jgi:SAM-dependent methyltransferase
MIKREPESRARPGAPPRESASRFTHEQVVRLVNEFVPAGAAVLDIPAGTGACVRRLRTDGYEVVASDIEAHPALPAASFRRADMDEPLPFADESFAAVVSIEGIEHIRRPFDFVRECRRVLRKDGVLVLSTPNISSLRSRWRWFLTGFHNKCKYPLDETRPLPRHHINMLAYPELRYMLHTGGFCITGVHTNRIKAASALFLPCVPLVWAATRLAMRRAARTPEHRRVVGETIRQLFSRPVLFGETMILVARPVR